MYSKCGNNKTKYPLPEFSDISVRRIPGSKYIIFTIMTVILVGLFKSIEF